MPRIVCRIIDDEDGTCLDLLGRVPEVLLHVEQPPDDFYFDRKPKATVEFPRWWTDLHIEILQYIVSKPDDPIQWRDKSEHQQLPPGRVLPTGVTVHLLPPGRHA